MDVKTRDKVAIGTIIGGAIVIAIAAIISVLGGDGWFFSILIPGIGLTLLLVGLGFAASIASPKQLKHPKAAAVCCAVAALAMLCFTVWRVLPNHTNEPRPMPAKTAVIDVVDGVRPVSPVLSGIGEVEQALARIPTNQRAAYLQKHWPQLATDVAFYLQHSGRVPAGQQVTNVTFGFGTLRNVRAESGDGKWYSGKTENHIIAYVTYSNDATVGLHKFIVKCLNGMVESGPGEQSLQNLGSFIPERSFRIRKGEGLAGHVGFPTAMILAERFDLPLYHGKRQSSVHRITPTDARALEHETDKVQVTVRVNEGDYFDLVHMTYEPAKVAVAPQKRKPADVRHKHHRK